MSAVWVPVAPGDLADRLADWLAGADAVLRVAVDGPPCADSDDLAESLIDLLRVRGRPAVHVRARDFWHDASVRLEHGREDVESYLGWLDSDTLRREVLLPAVDSGSYLPTLRDPDTNRSTREPARSLEPGSVLFVSGSVLLGRGLPFDRTVHLAMSASARARRTAPDEAWTLRAYAKYDATAHPVQNADVVIKCDDPRHPAVCGLPARSG